MSKIYSTQELIEVLAAEQRACMNGERLHLAALSAGLSPLLDQFVEPVGLQKFTAYDNFRRTIHEYQREHQVSGLIWQTVYLRDFELSLPLLHEQLISLGSDRRTLKSNKNKVIRFWQQVTQGMELFLSLQGGKCFKPATLTDVEHIVDRTEWAVLTHHGREERLEIILQLGWGKPEEATYRRGFPESGSEFIHAVFPGYEPLG
ncbi:MAG: hypothetical protein B0A82_04360 [Alkalinema sp. CACIAM 70d]|nr:MAG: hypothetical protein B0A82_04360 [Alkalinema sp. CACIAM 70d]